MRRNYLFYYIVTIAVGVFALPTFAVQPSYELMLLGSELEFCRSSKLTQCKPQSITKFSSGYTRKHTLYKLSSSQIKKVMNADRWNSSRQALRFELNLFLNELAKRSGTKILSYDQLVSRWKSFVIPKNKKKNRQYNTKRKQLITGHSLLLSLNNDEHDMIFDFLEVAQIDSFESPIKEQVIVQGTKSLESVQFGQQIIEQAKLINGHNKPKLLLITAGNRDSFIDIDAYQAFFNDIGGDTQWLPVDRALNTLLAEQGDCNELERYRANFLNSFERERIYPDKIAKQLKYCQQPSMIFRDVEQADAVIFIGNSPHLLRDSLIINNHVISDALQKIRDKLAANKLFIAALGNVSRAVVSHEDASPIIIDGSSEDAMFHGVIEKTANNAHCHKQQECDNKGVRYLTGGLGLFQFSMVDTNFSDKGRFARMAQVARVEKSTFALGIDKNTALLIREEGDYLTMQVAGSAGVTLLHNQQEKADKTSKTQLNDFKISYFTLGDIISWKNGEVNVTFPQWKNKVDDFLNQPQDYNNLLFSDNFYHFARQACLIKDSKWLSFAGRKKQYTVTLSKPENILLSMGGLKADDGFKLYCSYHALGLNITHR